MWHYAAAKVNLLPNRSNKETAGHAIDECDNNVLLIEYSNSNNVIKTMSMTCPEYGYDSKRYLHVNELTPTGYRIFLFDPIGFRFNSEDPRNNFWFVSNRFTKTLNYSPLTHDSGNDDNLIFDGNYCH